MARRGSGRIEARRWPVLIGVVVLLSLAGVANASVRAHRSANGPGAVLGLSVVDTQAGAASTAWYCAGPLPLKSAAESASLVLNNLSTSPVSAEIDVSQSSGASTVVSMVLQGESSHSFALGHSRSAGFAAAAILVNSAAVGVVEVVHGPEGVFSAPCVAADTNVDYLAGGSTFGANNMALALFDPGATPAVASVSFSTSSGSVAPPAFQGLPLAAGQLVVLNVGHYLPSQKVVAVDAASSGGRIVIGALDSTSVGPISYQSLLPGTPQLSSSWYFAPGPAGSSARQHFILSNPSSSALHVRLRLSGSDGTVSESIALPAGSTEIAAPIPERNASALRWAELSTRVGQPFSAALETTVGAAISLESLPGARGSPSSAQVSIKAKAHSTATAKSTAQAQASNTAVEKQVLSPTTIAPGDAITSSLFAPARGWLLVGQSDANQGEVVLIANPNNSPANLSLSQLGASPTSLARYGLLGVVVPGQGMLSLNLGAIYHAAGSVAIVLHSDLPLVAGPVIYARGSKGSVGFSAPAAIPVA